MPMLEKSPSIPVSTTAPLAPLDTFVRRHIGPSDADIAEMLAFIGHDSLDALTRATIPGSILSTRPLTKIGRAHV